MALRALRNGHSNVAPGCLPDGSRSIAAVGPVSVRVQLPSNAFSCSVAFRLAQRLQREPQRAVRRIVERRA